MGPKPGLAHPSSPLAPVLVALQSPARLFLAVLRLMPAWLHCLPSVWCCDKGPHGSRNDTVSLSASRCSDRDCLNSILSRGRVPWQLHKYLPAAATPLHLRKACLQATSAMFFFCPVFPLSLETVVCVVLVISFRCCWCLFFPLLLRKVFLVVAGFFFRLYTSSSCWNVRMSCMLALRWMCTRWPLW